MIIKLIHTLEKNDVKQRIESFLNDQIGKSMPHGIEVLNPQKRWDADVLHTSFKAKRGFLSVEIKGKITVDEKQIEMDIIIPAIVSSFVKEEEIKNALTKGAKSMLTTNQ